MRPVNYLTVLIPVEEGIAVRYTDYVMPSGTGSRIVTYMELPFLVETGKPLDAAQVEDRKAFLVSNYEQQMGRLTHMAEKAAAELASA